MVTHTAYVAPCVYELIHVIQLPNVCASFRVILLLNLATRGNRSLMCESQLTKTHLELNWGSNMHLAYMCARLVGIFTVTSVYRARL